jgi:hypothetical protein
MELGSFSGIIPIVSVQPLGNNIFLTKRAIYAHRCFVVGQPFNTTNNPYATPQQ